MVSNQFFPIHQFFFNDYDPYNLWLSLIILIELGHAPVKDRTATVQPSEETHTLDGAAPTVDLYGQSLTPPSLSSEDFEHNNDVDEEEGEEEEKVDSLPAERPGAISGALIWKGGKKTLQPREGLIF